MADNATGDDVIAEYFRNGSDPSWSSPVIVAGFGDGKVVLPWEASAPGAGATAVTTSTGQKRVIPKKADFGTLSSGGLY